MVERYNGIVEVRGSTPLSSTSTPSADAITPADGCINGRRAADARTRADGVTHGLLPEVSWPELR